MILTGKREEKVISSCSVFCPVFTQINRLVLCNIHTSTVLIKIQLDATICRYLFTAESLYMFRVSPHPSSGVLKTVTAASGTGHNMPPTWPVSRSGHVRGK